MPSMQTSPSPRENLVNPAQRLAFIKSQLSTYDSIRLVVTEASDANSPEAKGPFAHCLTIEKNGKGFRVQDIAVDADGTAKVSEHFITRTGRFFKIPGTSDTTDTAKLGELRNESTLRPNSPQDRYRNRVLDGLLDRLVVKEQLTNDVRERQPNQGIEVHRRELDSHLRGAMGSLGQVEVDQLLKRNALPHPLKSTIEMLVPLAKARAAQVQLSTTLRETGLAGFTFSGNDMM
jgi:hypothetical protein